jgi:subtilisin family serine protease
LASFLRVNFPGPRRNRRETISRLGRDIERLEERAVLSATFGPDQPVAHGAAESADHDHALYRTGELLVGLEGDFAESFAEQGALPALARAQAGFRRRALHSPSVLGYRPPRSGDNARLTTLWKLDASEDVLAAAARIAQLPGVAYAEPNYIVSTAAHQGQRLPNDSRFGDLWGLHSASDADIDAPEAWKLNTGSGQTVVAVIDTGINYQHADLAGNVWSNPLECPGGVGTCIRNNIDDDGNGFVDDFHGWDFVNDDNDPLDDNKHGTHVAGTIGAVGNNATGVVGVNWDVQLMALKFLNGSGSGDTADALASLNYINATMDALAARGIDLNIVATNNSWGGGAFQQSLYDAIDESGERGLLFMAAAGNNGGGSASYPALYDLDNILSVAATDKNDVLASFSNYGTGVDLAAPGDGILSTLRNSYGKLDGTSMATPHVTGAVALVSDLAGPTAAASEIRDYILSHVDLKSGLVGRVATNGRLNVARALERVKMNVVGSTPSAGEVLSAGSVFSVDFSHPATGLAAADFQINRPNGSVATPDSVAFTNSGRTAQFTFATGPFVVGLEGPYVMSMGAGAVATSASLHDPNLQAWSATIYYDTTPLAVTGVETDPPATAGNVVSLPVNSITVNFDQPISAGSADVGDLALSQGSVTGATLLDLDSDAATYEAVRYAVAGVTRQADWIVTLPDGAVSDLDGNPVAAFSETFIVDTEAVPWTSPFVPITPEGSLIYEATVDGIVNPAADVDEFTIEVDPNQTVTAIVIPDAGLRAALTVSTASGSASALAGGIGQNAVVQTVAAPAGGGPVTISVASAGSTTGSYRIQVLLNAAAGEPGNGALSSAQSIDGSFLAIGSGSRGAVRGTVKATVSPITAETEAGDAFLSKQNNLDGSWQRHTTFANGTALWKINGGAGVTGRLGERSGTGPSLPRIRKIPGTSRRKPATSSRPAPTASRSTCTTRPERS